MLTLSDIKIGRLILLDGQPHRVLSSEHSKMGRMGAVLRTKLVNLVTGAMFDKTFQGADKVDEATIAHRKAQYLYRDGDNFAFMDLESYEQFELGKNMVGDAVRYLTDGMEVSLAFFGESPIALELPIKVELIVTDAPPSVKGNTASGGDKVVTVQTGATFTTPLFIEIGDTIIVNTERGDYVGKK